MSLFQDLITANLLIVGALVAVLEALKQAGLVPVRMIELVAVILGALATVVLRGVSVEAVFMASRTLTSPDKGKSRTINCWDSASR